MDENAGYQKTASGRPLALEARGQLGDGRRFSPSTGRNKDIVRATFLERMPTTGAILEIASGTGEHGVHITEHATELTWTYSDIDPASQASQSAWRSHVDHDRLRGPLSIDTTRLDWSDSVEPEMKWSGLFCANMIHIAPFEAASGLLAGAGRLLRAGGRLMLYGPFARDGVIAESNQRFSEDLKRRDPRWGVRDLERDIAPLADAAGLDLEHVVEMPANNLSVILQRRAD